MIIDVVKDYVNNLNFTTMKQDDGDEIYVFDNQYLLKISDDSKKLLKEKLLIDMLNKDNIINCESEFILNAEDKTYYLRKISDQRIPFLNEY